MNVIDRVAADLAQLEEDLRRVPMKALREGEALVEWMDDIRERVWHARCSLTGDIRLNSKKAVPTARAKPSKIITPSGSVIPLQTRPKRRC